MAILMPFGSWPLLVKSRAQEPQRGEWRDFSSVTARSSLSSCGDEIIVNSNIYGPKTSRFRLCFGLNLMPFGSSSLLVIQVHGSKIAMREERMANWKILHSTGFSGGACEALTESLLR